jgi:hypothetical protein
MRDHRGANDHRGAGRERPCSREASCAASDVAVNRYYWQGGGEPHGEARQVRITWVVLFRRLGWLLPSRADFGIT